jgi:hypothetical protein
MLIGFVSDEYYAAIPDVAVEFERDGTFVAVVRSTPRGAIHADLSPGVYRVTLAKGGYGSKAATVKVDPALPCHFRLLSDSLYGYAWPKWVRSGETSEFRVHSVEPYHLTLWRYGQKKELVQHVGWFDEHGPRPWAQVLPDVDVTQRGVNWDRYGSPLITAPARTGL